MRVRSPPRAQTTLYLPELFLFLSRDPGSYVCYSIRQSSFFVTFTPPLTYTIETYLFFTLYSLLFILFYMSKKLLLPALFLAALIAMGAGCDNTSTPIPDNGGGTTTPPTSTPTSTPPNTAAATYGKVLEDWFEGIDRLYFEFKYASTTYTVSEEPKPPYIVRVKERASNRAMTIRVSYEAGRGWTPTDYWNETKPCPNCQTISPPIQISGVQSLTAYANNQKEYIMFNRDTYLFVIELPRNDEGFREVLRTMSFADPDTSNRFMTVKVALVVKTNELPQGTAGTETACGDFLVLTDRRILRTSAILSASMRELFGIPETYMDGILKQNIVAKTNLRYNRSAIENGVAKIYLTGSLASLKNACDIQHLARQIEQTAKQFNSVQSVEVYVNNQKVDWNKVIQDQVQI